VLQAAIVPPDLLLGVWAVAAATSGVGDFVGSADPALAALLSVRTAAMQHGMRH
jgi:hypothetical protein